MQELNKSHAKAVDRAMAWAKALGGSTVYSLSDQVVGVEFSEPPDAKLWVKNTGRGGRGWRPRRNTKAGKTLHEEMKDLFLPYCSKYIGKLLLGKEMVMVGTRLCGAGVDVIGDHLIVTARGQGWKPVDGLRELKASEYWALKEQEEDKCLNPE